MPLMNFSQALASLFTKQITAEHIHNPMTDGGNPRKSLLNNGDSKKTYSYGSTFSTSQETDKSSGTKVSFVSLTEETNFRPN